jgi:7-keto-8-aminopelargonate synthetase-like enzyme
VVDESHSLGVLGNNGCFHITIKKYQTKIMVAHWEKANLAVLRI